MIDYLLSWNFKHLVKKKMAMLLNKAKILIFFIIFFSCIFVIDNAGNSVVTANNNQSDETVHLQVDDQLSAEKDDTNYALIIIEGKNIDPNICIAGPDIDDGILIKEVN